MLKIITGRSGSGKTNYIFNSIAENIKQGEDNILLITPEQYSFVSERKLLKLLGEENVNKVENASFTRLNSFVSEKYGNFSLPILSKGSKAVMLKKACEKCKDELTLFSKNINNTAFINSFVKVYDEMKSCRVTAEDIMDASNNTDKPVLSQKLHDISVITSVYDELIKDKYIDNAEELTYLYQRLCTLDYFTGRTVYIDGFNGFVAQEYKIIEVILSQAKDVYITFCTDSYLNGDKYDLFSYVNSNISILYDVAKKENINVAPPINLTKNYRAHNDEMLYLEKNLYCDVKTAYENKTENIELYRAKNIVDECDYVSSSISKLLRSDVNPCDITVICRDMDKYQHQLEYSFKKFNVPYFNDERQNISSQPLIMFVNFLFRISEFYYKSDDIFSLVKTGLTHLDTQDICALENYVFVWNINGAKWKNEFTDSPRGISDTLTDSDKKQLTSINEARNYISSKLEKFISSTKKTDAKGISKAIYYTLLDFGVDEKLRDLAVSLDSNGRSSLAQEQGRIWDLLMNFLNELALIDEGSIISVKEYKKLFSLMISNEDLGSVPGGLDNVQFGSADRIRCNNPYACFILGANEGEFPKNIVSSGILTESDRATLIDNDFKLYSYGETMNAQEKYFAYMACVCPSSKLYVSFGGAGDNANESTIVEEIKAIFPEITVSYDDNTSFIDKLETDANAFEILASNFDKNDEYISTLKEYFSDKEKYRNRLEAVKRINDNQDLEIKDSKISTDLFGKDMYLSASRIEDYYNCAFRYFCKFGIKARPLKKVELNSMQTGTVIHYVLECLLREKGSQGLITLDDAEITLLVDKYLKIYFERNMGESDLITSRFKYSYMRLSKMIVSVVKRLRDEFAVSDFEPKAFELTIGDCNNGEKAKSQVLNLPDGGSIQIKGSIDRVDTFVQDGVQYVRVVDYKSGSKDFELNDILHGLNLQMFIYLFNLCKSDSELAGTQAGVLYMHAARSVYKGKRSDNDFASQEDDEFRMKGLIVNDDEHHLAEHMDRENSYKYIPVKEGKDGKLTGNIISLAQLGRISDKIDQLVMSMGVNLHNGKINQNPVLSKTRNRTCEFCDYGDVCVNRTEIEFNEIEDHKFEEVLETLATEENND